MDDEELISQQTFYTPSDRVLNGFALHLTCDEFPEQYDVLRDDKQVAYFRMRRGEFRVDVPRCGGHTILMTDDVEGKGQFKPREREHWLRVAIDRVAWWCSLSETEQRNKIRETVEAEKHLLRMMSTETSGE